MTLAKEETEKEVATKRRKRNYARIRIGKHPVSPNTWDDRHEAQHKASTMSMALARMMSHVGREWYTCSGRKLNLTLYSPSWKGGTDRLWNYLK